MSVDVIRARDLVEGTYLPNGEQIVKVRVRGDVVEYWTATGLHSIGPAVRFVEIDPEADTRW